MQEKLQKTAVVYFSELSDVQENVGHRFTNVLVHHVLTQLLLYYVRFSSFLINLVPD